MEQVWASETLLPWTLNDSLLVSCREYGPGGAYEFWSLGQPKVEIENLCHELQLEDQSAGSWNFDLPFKDGKRLGH